MKASVARLLPAVLLVGAMSGVLSGGVASAATCQPVTSAILVCTNQENGHEVLVFSDIVEVHGRLLYQKANHTGATVGDGFTNQSSGAFISCNTSKHKYQLTAIVRNNVKTRPLAIPC